MRGGIEEKQLHSFRKEIEREEKGVREGERINWFLGDRSLVNGPLAVGFPSFKTTHPSHRFPRGLRRPLIYDKAALAPLSLSQSALRLTRIALRPPATRELAREFEMSGKLVYASQVHAYGDERSSARGRFCDFLRSD